MTLPERYDLVIDQGATLKRWFRLLYPDGSTVNLVTAGYTVGTMVIRDVYGGTIMLTMTTANGGLSVTQEADAQGTLQSGYFYASPSATAVLTDWGDGVFTFEIDNGSDVIRALEGIATLSPETTI